MTINDFLTGITKNITNQTSRRSITPGIVGGGFTDLANIVSNISGGTQDLSDYYTKEESNILFLSGITGSEIITALGFTPISGATTLSGYGIVSGDTLFNTKYQPIGNYLSGNTLANYLTTSGATVLYQPVGNYVSGNTLNNYLTLSGASASYQPVGFYVSASTLNNYYTTGQTDSKYIQTSGLTNYLTTSGASASYLPISSGQTILNLQTGLTATNNKLSGGTTGQVLTKIDNTNFNIQWVNPAGGGDTIKVYNVENYGAVHDGVTDDTEAIQDAINAVNAAGGGVVYFPNGVYALNSPVYDVDSNSQLIVPVNLFADSITNNHIKLLGEVAPNFYSQPFTDGTLPPNTGVILKSNLSGAINVIGSKSGTSPWGNFNYCHLDIENITIRLKSKTGTTNVAPAATAINAEQLAYLSILNVRIDTESPQADIVQPLNTCFGIKTPITNNFVMVNIDKCYVMGVFTAFELSEHASLDNIFIDGCYEGISFVSSNHPALINKICIARTRTNVVVKGVMPFTITQLAIEDNISGWFTNVYDLDERVSGALGYIRYNRILGGTGEQMYPFKRKGAGTVIVEEINATPHIIKFTDVSTDYLLTFDDIGRLVSVNQSGSSFCYVPTNSNVSIPIGAKISISQKGNGAVTITPLTSGVTINSAAGLNATNGQFAVVDLIKTDVDNWLLSGNLAAGAAPIDEAAVFISTTGISGGTEQSAVSNLVTALKSAGIWSKIIAIYPFVGSGEVPCSYNLRDVTKFRAVFNGAKSFNSSGYVTNGSTSYADTGLNPSTAGIMLINSAHACVYSPSSSVNNGSLAGGAASASPSNVIQFTLNFSGTNYSSINTSVGAVKYPAASNFSGIWLLNRITSNAETLDRNSSVFGSVDFISNGLPEVNMFIGAYNNNGTASQFSNNGCGFASFGAGLTPTEKTTFNSVVQSFLTALSR